MAYLKLWMGIYEIKIVQDINVRWIPVCLYFYLFIYFKWDLYFYYLFILNRDCMNAYPHYHKLWYPFSYLETWKTNTPPTCNGGCGPWPWAFLITRWTHPGKSLYLYVKWLSTTTTEVLSCRSSNLQLWNHSPCIPYCRGHPHQTSRW